MESGNCSLARVVGGYQVGSAHQVGVVSLTCKSFTVQCMGHRCSSAFCLEVLDAIIDAGEALLTAAADACWLCCNACWELWLRGMLWGWQAGGYSCSCHCQGPCINILSSLYTRIRARQLRGCCHGRVC